MPPRIPIMDPPCAIRTYETNYYSSDNESAAGPADVPENPSDFEDDPLNAEEEDTAENRTARRLGQNIFFLENQLAPIDGTQSTWKVAPVSVNEEDVLLVVNPTASGIGHNFLNPYVCRYVQEISSLDQLATLLDTPNNWEVRFEQIFPSPQIQSLLIDLRSLPNDTNESTIQSGFLILVYEIARSIGMPVFTRSETKFIVGGLLAKHVYDIRGRTCLNFINADGMNVIASEVKTDSTYPDERIWYHSSRGAQVLSSLYAFNCPTFLITQTKWKVFIENKERNAVLTFPFGQGSLLQQNNASKPLGIGKDFVKAIVICLLSNRVQLRKSEKDPSVKEQAKMMMTPSKKERTNIPDSGVKQSKRLKTIKKSTDSGPNQPVYFAGYVDGEAVYQPIRIVPPEEVERIENELLLKEKMVQKNQTSEDTLLNDS